MKKVEAIITPFKLDEVKDALTRYGIDGMTASEVREYESRAGRTRIDFQPKLKIEIVVHDDQLSAVVETLEQAARIGTSGVNDGRILVFPIEDAVRIRSGGFEHDVAAIRRKSRVDSEAPALSVPHSSLLPSRM
jgi:nitrogen regulatory protein PII